ncbi:MAG: tetratricopeptide repeat protein [Synergistaceae bacterium]|nr:tetratricopeptide repeat protein [Synergistaceae bacterium]
MSDDAKDEEGKNKKANEKNEDINETINTVGRDGATHPLLAPPERTGLTPAEEAYVPRHELRSLPKGLFFVVAAAVILAFVIGGTIFYRDNILPERLFHDASRLFEEGEYARALETYQKVMKLKPDRRGTMFRIGYSEEMLGNDADAISAYEAHVKNEQRDAEALFRLGSLYFRHGMRPEALDALEKLEGRVSPVSVDFMLGAIRESMGSIRGAAESYKGVIRSATSDSELIYTTSVALMRLGYYGEALEGFASMEKYVASDDKRPFHSSNAAKAMLGWPTDRALVITPGKAIGNLALGGRSEDVLAEWGTPIERVSEGEHSIWGYGGNVEALETLVYMQNDLVIEIVTSAKKYRTSDGLGVGNFLEPKYADRFERWSAEREDSPPYYRYNMKGGGLAFYTVGDNSTAVVYDGEQPLSSADGYEWMKLE